MSVTPLFASAFPLGLIFNAVPGAVVAETVRRGAPSLRRLNCRAPDFCDLYRYDPARGIARFSALCSVLSEDLHECRSLLLSWLA